MKKREDILKVIDNMECRLFDKHIKFTKKEDNVIDELIDKYDLLFDLLTFLKGHIYVDGFTLKVNCKDLNFNQVEWLENLLND